MDQLLLACDICGMVLPRGGVVEDTPSGAVDASVFDLFSPYCCRS